MFNLENNTTPATTPAAATTPVAVAMAKALTYETLPEHLKTLTTDRQGWEKEELLRSNDRLYSILLGCYEAVWAMNGVSGSQKAMKEAFKTYCEKNGYSFKDSTHLTARIVGVVFGNIDRRRTSAYGKALKNLLLDGVKPAAFIAEVKKAGGIEEIRRNGGISKPTTADRAKVGRQALHDPVLGTVTIDPLISKFDKTSTCNAVILIATPEADGSFAIRRVVQKESLVTTALASIAGAVEEEQKQAKQVAVRQSTDEAREQAIKNAIPEAA